MLLILIFTFDLVALRITYDFVYRISILYVELSQKSIKEEELIAVWIKITTFFKRRVSIIL